MADIRKLARTFAEPRIKAGVSAATGAVDDELARVEEKLANLAAHGMPPAQIEELRAMFQARGQKQAQKATQAATQTARRQGYADAWLDEGGRAQAEMERRNEAAGFNTWSRQQRKADDLAGVAPIVGALSRRDPPPEPHEDWVQWRKAKAAADAATGKGSLFGAAKQFYLDQIAPDKYEGRKLMSDAGATNFALPLAPLLPALPALGTAGGLRAAALVGGLPEVLPTLLGDQTLEGAAVSAAKNVIAQKWFNTLLGAFGKPIGYNKLDKFLGSGAPQTPLHRNVVTAEVASDIADAPLANRLLSNPSTQMPVSRPTEALPADNWPGQVAKSNQMMDRILKGTTGRSYPMQGVWSGDTIDLVGGKAAEVPYTAYNAGHFIEFPDLMDAALTAPKIAKEAWQKGVGWGEVTRAPTIADFATSPLKALKASLIPKNAAELQTPNYQDVLNVAEQAGVPKHLIVHDGRGRTFIHPWNDNLPALMERLEKQGLSPRPASLDTEYFPWR